MKTISTTAILALMTASIGLGAVAPALAQNATPAAPAAQTQPADPSQAGERGFRNGPGMRQGGKVEIVSGLATGDRVVLKAGASLREGEAVLARDVRPAQAGEPQ